MRARGTVVCARAAVRAVSRAVATPVRRFTVAIAALMLLSVSSASWAGRPPMKPEYYAPQNLILVLGAVPQEITVFREAMGNPPKNVTWGIPYWRGVIEGKNVVVAITGIGKTFTGMTTTLFIHEFKPRLVLMSGTGARINPELRTGDVIVATETHEHDYGSLTREGMVYRPFNSADGGEEVDNEFSPPKDLLEIADKAIEDYRAPEVSANGSTYTVKVRRGVVSSSDLFGVPQERIDLLRKKWKTDIMEMESAPLGLVCQTLGVPYLIIRAGSNVAQEAPNNDYLKLGPIAAKQAARFSLHLIGSL